MALNEPQPVPKQFNDQVTPASLTSLATAAVIWSWPDESTQPVAGRSVTATCGVLDGGGSGCDGGFGCDGGSGCAGGFGGEGFVTGGGVDDVGGVSPPVVGLPPPLLPPHPPATTVSTTRNARAQRKSAMVGPSAWLGIQLYKATEHRILTFLSPQCLMACTDSAES